jgi:hypothetical protein
MATEGNGVRRTGWSAVATALVVVSVAVSGCAGSTSATATKAVASTTSAGAPPVVRASIPITIQGGQGTRSGARPMVEVRVGTSAPVPLLLDTGSTGLQIFAAVVKTTAGSGVRVGTQRDRITYAGGHRLTGVVATAKIAIGSQVTATPVAFGLVQQAVCLPTKPTCPVAGGIAAAMARGFSGILGIGMNRGPNGLASPILGMAGDLARSWSIHLSGKTGALVLGAPLETGSSDVVTIPVKSRGTVGTNRFWDDIVHLCVSVGLALACAPGIFDSGTFSVELWQKRWPQLAAYPGSSLVAAGEPVSVYVAGSATAFWEFMTGTERSADTVTLRTNAIVNTGVQAYYAFTITYDEVHGAISLT